MCGLPQVTVNPYGVTLVTHGVDGGPGLSGLVVQTSTSLGLLRPSMLDAVSCEGRGEGRVRNRIQELRQRAMMRERDRDGEREIERERERECKEQSEPTREKKESETDSQ